MADKPISTFDWMNYPDIDNQDYIAVVDDSANKTKRSKIIEIAKRILGNRAIGTNVADALVTTNANQDLTNKRLNSPKINSATDVTATSEELNKLAGCITNTSELNKLAGVTVTPAEINMLAGAAPNIQSQIDNIYSQISGVTGRLYRYSLELTSDGSNYEVTQSDILSACNLSTSIYVIEHSSIIYTVYERSSDSYEIISDITNTKMARKTVNGQPQLKDVTLGGLSNTHDYLFVMHFMIDYKTGI